MLPASGPTPETYRSRSIQKSGPSGVAAICMTAARIGRKSAAARTASHRRRHQDAAGAGNSPRGRASGAEGGETSLSVLCCMQDRLMRVSVSRTAAFLVAQGKAEGKPV
jgi:hypothetical protein